MKVWGGECVWFPSDGASGVPARHGRGADGAGAEEEGCRGVTPSASRASMSAPTFRRKATRSASPSRERLAATLFRKSAETFSALSPPSLSHIFAAAARSCPRSRTHSDVTAIYLTNAHSGRLSPWRGRRSGTKEDVVITNSHDAPPPTPPQPQRRSSCRVVGRSQHDCGRRPDCHGPPPPPRGPPPRLRVVWSCRRPDQSDTWSTSVRRGKKFSSRKDPCATSLAPRVAFVIM
jgi:hypothetical protein